MLARPLLRPDLRVLVADGETLLVVGEDRHVRLSGGAVAEVLPLLDGTRRPEEIAAALDERTAPEAVYYTLLDLERRGYLVEPDGAAPERLALLARLGVATNRLSSARVRTAAIGELDPGPLAGALAELGVARDSEAPLAVVLADDYLRDELHEENREALASGRPWLLANPVGAVLWLGPLFVPGETGCWECLAHRLRGHRLVEQLAATGDDATLIAPTPATTTATESVAAGLVAGEVVKQLAGGGSALHGRLRTLDLAALALAEHAVPHRPQCPACGDPTLGTREARVTLRPLRASVGAGGERVLEPAETVRRLSHLVSPITGVVRSLERFDVPAPLHLYRAGRVPGFRPTSTTQLEVALQFVAGGKGPTDEQAKASALCEGIERYCASALEPRVTVEAPYLEVAERALHPDDLLLFSESQRRERRERNAAADHPRQWIPEPFDPEQPTAWTEAWPISGGEPRLLPTAFCYLGFQLPEGHRFCRGDSNGCAAGNEPEEAVLQGLLELVERDAIALWWYTRARRPGLDLSTSGSRYVSSVVESYRELGRNVWALDLTNDLGIPAVAALSCRSENGRSVTLGFGAHLDAEVALVRALTELSQMTFGVEAPARLPTLDRWLADVRLTDEPWLVADGMRELASSGVSGDLADDVRSCADAIARAGHETLVVDLTLPDVGVPVVRVVAPGLRHFWPRFAPGRLYDVPVSLGWLERPVREQDLNPYPIVW